MIISKDRGFSAFLVGSLLALTACSDNTAEYSGSENSLVSPKNGLAFEPQGDITLTDNAFNIYLKAINRSNVKGKFRDRLKDEWITKELFSQKAAMSGLDKNPQYLGKMAQYRRELLSQAYVDTQLDKHFPDEILKQQYISRKEEFTTQEIHLAHILTAVDVTAEKEQWKKSKIESEENLLKIGDGELFEKLAQKISSDTSTNERGGDFGWMPIDIANRRFGDVFGSLEKGELIGPVRTQQGWHIIFVLDEKREIEQSFEEVKWQMKEQNRPELLKYLKIKMLNSTKIVLK